MTKDALRCHRCSCNQSLTAKFKSVTAEVAGFLKRFTRRTDLLVAQGMMHGSQNHFLKVGHASRRFCFSLRHTYIGMTSYGWPHSFVVRETSDTLANCCSRTSRFSPKTTM